MNVTDPIADLLTRIRNAQQAGISVLSIPASKMKIAIVHILKEEGFIKAYKCIRDNKQGVIKVALKYLDEKHLSPVIQHIERQSLSSRRKYVRHEDIPYVKNGFGVGILSTSKGVMTCKHARTLKIGGEYICSVY